MATTNITNNYIIANFSASAGERRTGTAGTPGVSGVKSTGSIGISVAGASFDSADYPRVTIADGTNTLTFVIDNDARGLKLDDGTTDALQWSSTSDQPFEDSQIGRIVIPTKDNYQSGSGALISFHPSDFGDWTDHVHNLGLAVVSASNGSGLTDITARPHFVFRDAANKTIKVGIGPSGSFIAAGGGTLTTTGSYGGGGDGGTAPSFRVWREGSTSNYYVSFNSSGGGNQWRSLAPWIHVINAARANNTINMEAFGLKQNGAYMSQTAPSLGGGWTPQSPYGILYRSTITGAAGNTAYMKFVDPTNYFSSSTQQRMVSWGYDEHNDTGVLQAALSHRHGSTNYSGQTNSQYFGEHKNTKIYFRQGTISGSTASGASLSAVNIAECLKDAINASELNMTASRASTTVNLTHSTNGTVGNVSISSVSGSGKLTTAGMAGGVNAVSSTPSTYTAADFVQYRMSYRGAQNIRGQTTSARYRTFIGEDKT